VVAKTVAAAAAGRKKKLPAACVIAILFSIAAHCAGAQKNRTHSSVPLAGLGRAARWTRWAGREGRAREVIGTVN
jgi:hypothetical protein